MAKREAKSDAIATVANAKTTAANHTSGGWRKTVRGEDLIQMQEELWKLAIFANCSEGFYRQLAEHFRIKTFSEGQTIVETGHPANHLLVVRRGVAQMFVDGLHVERIMSGRYFGETTLLGLDRSWSATLRAENVCTIAELSRDDFLSVLVSFPELEKWFENLTLMNEEVLTDGTLTNTCEIFQDLSQETLSQLDKRIVRRIYFEGERFLVQGDSGGELYMMVRGQSNIEIGGRIVRTEVRGVDEKEEDDSANNPSSEIPMGAHRSRRTMRTIRSGDPVCFGEQGLLGTTSVRSATVRATQATHLRVLHRPVFLKILEECHESLHMDKMSRVLDQWGRGSGDKQSVAMATTSKTLQEVDIFKQLGCSSQFLDFLAGSLEERIYLQGQKIIIEDTVDDSSAYILNWGTVKVLQGGREIGQLESGSVFGEVVLFGLSTKRSSTVVASSTCQTQVLHQNVVIRGLELFPDDRQKVLMIAFARSNKDDQSESQFKASASMNTISSEDWQAVELRAVMKAVKSSKYLANIPAAFMEDLSKVSAHRIYMPGDLIIEEGKDGDSMFIMVSGNASVYATAPDDQAAHHAEDAPHPVTKIGVAAAGSISGELAMLGVSQTRSATIEAETICCMWEISHDSALSIMERMPEARQQFADIIVQHLQHLVPPIIDGLPLFRQFDQKFRMLLGLNSERYAFFPGQQIFAEGQPGEGLYVVNLGRAQLEKKGITIKTYTHGSHFNSTIMLGIHQFSFCSLNALQTCHVVVISNASFLQALDHYPSEQAAVRLMRQEYAASEEFKMQIQRLCMRTTIWQRAMAAQKEGPQSGQAPTLALPACDFGHSRLTDEQRKRRTFRTWYKHAEACKSQRAASEKRHEFIEDWVTKKKHAVATRRFNEELRRAATNSLREDVKLPPARRRPRCHSGDGPLSADPLRLTASREHFPAPPNSSRSDRLERTNGAEVRVTSAPPLPDVPQPPSPGPRKTPRTPRIPTSPEDGLPPLLLPDKPLSPRLRRYPEVSSIYRNWRLKMRSGVREQNTCACLCMHAHARVGPSCLASRVNVLGP